MVGAKLKRERLTSALDCFTSFFLNKNCRFRFEMSIVSKSSTVILPNPVKTIFFTAFHKPIQKQSVSFSKRR